MMIPIISRLVCGFMTVLIRVYQVVISPHIGNCCRFEPSCSQYVIEALQIHGFFKGSWLGFKRIMRCRPFGPSGYDPVPAKSDVRRVKREE
jgi:hypothetical protein